MLPWFTGKQKETPKSMLGVPRFRTLTNLWLTQGGWPLRRSVTCVFSFVWMFLSVGMHGFHCTHPQSLQWGRTKQKQYTTFSAAKFSFSTPLGRGNIFFASLRLRPPAAPPAPAAPAAPLVPTGHPPPPLPAPPPPAPRSGGGEPMGSTEVRSLSWGRDPEKRDDPNL